MTYRLIICAEAEADLVAAASWYENERPNLGIEFLSEARRVIHNAVANPFLYPAISRRPQAHRALTPTDSPTGCSIASGMARSSSSPSSTPNAAPRLGRSGSEKRWLRRAGFAGTPPMPNPSSRRVWWFKTRHVIPEARSHTG